MRATKRLIKYQLGQAYMETLACLTVVFVFLGGAQYLWRSAELAQIAVDAVRFAAWERTVWEPSDNDTEVYALHKTNEQLGKDVVLRQLSTPAAWRNFRASLSASGEPAAGSSHDRWDFLHRSVRHFIRDGKEPNDMISVDTNSGWGEGNEDKFRGEDPTLGKITSFKLDKDTWRTVYLTLKSDYRDNVFSGFSEYAWKVEAVETKKKLSLITNSWAASPPVSFVRDRQLMPLSTADSLSGFQGNTLGTNLKHPWALVGGPNGFGGQYLARQIGVNASQAAQLVHSSGESFDFDMVNPMASLGLMAQTQQSEYFNPNAVSQWHHRHTFIIADTAEHKAEPDTKARNSNIGKKKYRAFSGQNPIDTYFTR